MGKYTPGPWRHETVFDKIGNPCAYSVWPCNQSGVRHRICMTPDGTTCENLRNAQLIAAAPDLLAALKAILPMAENGAAKPGHEGFCGPEQSCDCECMYAAYDSERLYQARAAIRKAEGES